jgi:hypothetical protein
LLDSCLPCLPSTSPPSSRKKAAHMNHNANFREYIFVYINMYD